MTRTRSARDRTSVRRHRARFVRSFALLLFYTCAMMHAQNFSLTEDQIAEAPFLADGWHHLPVASIEDALRDGPPVDLVHGGRDLSSPLLRSEGRPDDWTGAGWFLLDLDVPPDLVGFPLGLSMPRHYGASRIYVDGELLASAGSPSLDSEMIVPRTRPDPVLFEFDEPGAHRLAVLFANPDLDRYHRVGYPAGFNAQLQPAATAIERARTTQRGAAHRRGLFTSVFIAFALLHMLFFLFRPEGGANLSFAIFCWALATLVFLLEHKRLVNDPRIVFWSEAAMNIAGLLFAVLGTLFVHQIFSQRIPRALLAAFAVLALTSPWFVLRPAASVSAVFVIMLLGLLEMARGSLRAVIQRRDGARVVAFGVMSLTIGFGLGLLANLGILPPIRALTTLVPFYSMPILIFAMSISLSRRYALTHSELEQQLERVRELSAERLEQERRERRQELQTKLLEAEVARRDAELEEARQLQLSMLPQSIPELPRVELAAHMTTATEVGGDYYDFAVGADGCLTIAVGDATGHGLRAGTMVTATKSLFNALGDDANVVSVAQRSNLALKRMNLRNLNMAMLLARLEGDRLVVVSAGMPQPLVYRSGPGHVEPLETGGMPLGAMAKSAYHAVETTLAAGDVVLFMSDGFPERLNANGEELGYDAAADAFRSVARRPSREIVIELDKWGHAWAQGAEAADDVTFVVVKAL